MARVGRSGGHNTPRTMRKAKKPKTDMWSVDPPHRDPLMNPRNAHSYARRLMGLHTDARKGSVDAYLTLENDERQRARNLSLPFVPIRSLSALRTKLPRRAKKKLSGRAKRA